MEPIEDREAAAADEELRLAGVAATGLLDSPPEREFDELVSLAAGTEAQAAVQRVTGGTARR